MKPFALFSAALLAVALTASASRADTPFRLADQTPQSHASVQLAHYYGGSYYGHYNRPFYGSGYYGYRPYYSYYYPRPYPYYNYYYPGYSYGYFYPRYYSYYPGYGYGYYPGRYGHHHRRW